MFDKAETTETDTPTADESNADRWLILVFVVCILLGLALSGWHYQASGTTDILCANPDARCGDKADGNPQ